MNCSGIFRDTMNNITAVKLGSSYYQLQYCYVGLNLTVLIVHFIISLKSPELFIQNISLLLLKGCTVGDTVVNLCFSLDRLFYFFTFVMLLVRKRTIQMCTKIPLTPKRTKKKSLYFCAKEKSILHTSRIAADHEHLYERYTFCCGCKAISQRPPLYHHVVYFCCYPTAASVVCHTTAAQYMTLSKEKVSNM